MFRRTLCCACILSVDARAALRGAPADNDAWDALTAESDSPHWEQFAEQQEAKDEGKASKSLDDGKSPDAFVQVRQPSNDPWDALNAESDSPHWEQFAEQQEAKDEGKGAKDLDDGRSPDAFVQVKQPSNDAWDALNAESDSPHWEQFAEQQEAKDEGKGSKNLDDGKSPDAFVQIRQPSNDAWDALNEESDSPHWEQFAEQQEAKDEGKSSKNLDDGKSPDAFVQVKQPSTDAWDALNAESDSPHWEQFAEQQEAKDEGKGSKNLDDGKSPDAFMQVKQPSNDAWDALNAESDSAHWEQFAEQQEAKDEGKGSKNLDDGKSPDAFVQVKQPSDDAWDALSAESDSPHWEQFAEQQEAKDEGKGSKNLDDGKSPDAFVQVKQPSNDAWDALNAESDTPHWEQFAEQQEAKDEGKGGKNLDDGKSPDTFVQVKQPSNDAWDALNAESDSPRWEQFAEQQEAKDEGKGSKNLDDGKSPDAFVQVKQPSNDAWDALTAESDSHHWEQFAEQQEAKDEGKGSKNLDDGKSPDAFVQVRQPSNDAWDALNAESDSPHWEQFAEQQEAKDEGKGAKDLDDGRSPDAFVQVKQPSSDAWDALNAESDSPHWEQFAEQQEAKDEGKGSQSLDDGKSPDAFVQVKQPSNDAWDALTAESDSPHWEQFAEQQEAKDEGKGAKDLDDGKSVDA